MPKIEYLDPAIAGEGQKADAGVVLMEPAHVFDYAPLKLHKTYGKYFAPYVYERYPAIFYHVNGEQRTVTNHDEASELDGVRPIRGGWVCDGEWHASEEDAHKVKPSLTEFGKTVVQRGASEIAGGTNEIMAQILERLTTQRAAANPAMDQEYQDYLAWKKMRDGAPKVAEPIDEKKILMELAAEKGIKTDARWGIDRLKSELDKYDEEAA